MSTWNSYKGSESLHILRLIVLLDRLTNCRYGVRTAELLEYLRDRNIGVSMRQLQRDLLLLESCFRIDGRTDDRGRRIWRWRGLEWFDSHDEQSPKSGSWPLLHDRELPLCLSIRFLDRSEQIDSRAMKLVRILCLAELLPSEYEGDWISISALCASLRAYGFTACKRSVQRDMLFIRKHFLVLERNAGGRRKEWQRLEEGDWHYSFEPRFPEPVEREHPRVHAFLYAPSAACWEPYGARAA
ncbi:MAG: hypothetical protein U5L08_07925 [Xanthomonadales bacterium]|nr:hypothetical protein [Xanthomonadales bacterium]